MRKTLVLMLLALLGIASVYAQGFESFENFPATGSSYSSGTFAGQDGSTWTYVQARGDYEITAKALMIGRNRTPQSECYSGTISGGIGTLSFDYMQAFSTNANLNVYVNDVVVGNVTTTSQQSVVLNSGAITVNVPGDFVLKFMSVNNSDGQVVIDNITWTAYSGAPTPTISVVGSLDPFSAWTGTPSASQSYTLAGAFLTGPLSVMAPAGFALSTDDSNWSSNLNLASDFSGTIYVRLTGSSAGTFSGNITHNSTGADEVLLPVSGTVTDPSPMINITGALDPFSTEIGTPSPTQSYYLEGLFLSENISVTAPTGYELSVDQDTWQNMLSLASTFSGSIYVRLTGNTLGTFAGDIIHTSFTTVEVLAVTGEVTPPSGPTTYLEENFDYVAGTLLTDNGWTAHSGAGTNPLIVATTGLVYPGYPAASGLAAQTVFSGSAEDAHIGYENQFSGDIYTAFLYNASEVKTTGDYGIHLGPNPTGPFYGRFFAQKDAENNVRFGVSKASTSPAYTDYLFSQNETYLVVLKYSFVDGSNNDIVTLFVNPVIGPTEPAPLLSAPDLAGNDAASIGSFAIRQGTNTPIARIDGIRVTNSWPLLFSGDLPDPPVLSVTGDLEPFAAYVNTPSEVIQSYQLSGENLIGVIDVDAPEGFELSVNGVDGWTDTLSLPTSFNGSVYVRLYAPTVGTWGGDIVHSSSGADPVTIRVEGETFPPDVTWNINASLVPFETEAGTPSAAQSYSLSVSNPLGDLYLTVDSPFEISTSAGSGWATMLTLPSTFNSLVYVRLNTDAVGDYTGIILHNTAGASDTSLELSGTASPQPGMAIDLFFSEYIEGGSNNKAIEIFNGTGGPVDLSNYQVELYANGAAEPGNTQVLSGTLAHGDVFVIANSGSVQTVLDLADITSTVTYYNGDDALALRKISTNSIVDIFGVLGSDPGSSWMADGGYSTLNKTLVRKPDVIQGITINPIPSDPPAPTDFVTLGTEWDVFPQDTFSYLGYHVFSPGQEVAATPEITPAGGLYFNPVEVVITASTPGSVIRFTTDGTDPDESSTIFVVPFIVSENTTVKAKAFADGYTASPVAMNVYHFPVDVADIATLRAGATDGTVYKLTGEAILTFQQSNRNQKYIQDDTAAIVIDDFAGNIVSAYNLYDGITGIIGSLSSYANLLQFVPAEDPGPATSTNNVVVPEVRTLASLTSDDQAKLIKVVNVTIDGTGNFGSTAQNLPVSDPSGTSVMRTFPDADYSGTPIPQEAQDIICLVGQYNADMQIGPRFLSDFSPASGILLAPMVTINNTGTTIQVNWEPVTGATSYRVEGASQPEGPYTELDTTTGGSWVGPAENMKFFRVIAIN